MKVEYCQLLFNLIRGYDSTEEEQVNLTGRERMSSNGNDTQRSDTSIP